MVQVQPFNGVAAMELRSGITAWIAAVRWRYKIGWHIEVADYSFGYEFWRCEITGKLRMVER